MTTTPGLDIVQERLRAAARDRRANVLMCSAAGIEIQRIKADVRAGRATEASLIRDAGILLGAALSSPYRPLTENTMPARRTPSEIHRSSRRST